jgi:YHS domain-containing protein
MAFLRVRNLPNIWLAGTPRRTAWRGTPPAAIVAPSPDQAKGEIMLRRTLTALGVLAVLSLGSYVAVAQDGKPTTRPKSEYPLDMCPVMNVKIDSKGSPVTFEQDGRTVKVCCARCERSFKADAERFHKKMDAMITAKQKAGYPLKTCLVSGEELGGEMGEPVNYVHRPTNQLVRFCCAGCVDAFKEEPAKFLVKLEEAPRE